MPEEAQVKPFTTWLAEQRKGALQAELGEALAELAVKVMEHEKPGTLTLSLTLRPTTTGSHALFVADKLTVKAPEADPPVSMFFADETGNLSRRDPRQPELPLREVPGPREQKEAAGE